MSVIHEQQAEEQIGRWENRCEGFRSDGYGGTGFATWTEVCDRTRGHVGLHHGRRLNLRSGYVVAYVRWPK